MTALSCFRRAVAGHVRLFKWLHVGFKGCKGTETMAFFTECYYGASQTPSGKPRASYILGMVFSLSMRVACF